MSTKLVYTCENLITIKSTYTSSGTVFLIYLPVIVSSTYHDVSRSKIKPHFQIQTSCTNLSPESRLGHCHNKTHPKIVRKINAIKKHVTF